MLGNILCAGLEYVKLTIGRIILRQGGNLVEEVGPSGVIEIF